MMASMQWKQCWQTLSQEYSPKNKRYRLLNAFLSGPASITTKLKMTVPWVGSSPVMKCGFALKNQNQNDNQWNVDIQIPHLLFFGKKE